MQLTKILGKRNRFPNRCCSLGRTVFVKYLDAEPKAEEVCPGDELVEVEKRPLVLVVSDVRSKLGVFYRHKVPPLDQRDLFSKCRIAYPSFFQWDKFQRRNKIAASSKQLKYLVGKSSFPETFSDNIFYFPHRFCQDGALVHGDGKEEFNQLCLGKLVIRDFERFVCFNQAREECLQSREVFKRVCKGMNDIGISFGHFPAEDVKTKSGEGCSAQEAVLASCHEKGVVR